MCTDESYRGKGLAARLVRHLVARIEGRGETPMLHAGRRQHQRDPALRDSASASTFAVTGYRATP